MNPNIWMMLYIAGVFGFSGYILGELIGYGRGIKSAARIWESSLKQITTAFIEALPEKKDNN